MDERAISFVLPNRVASVRYLKWKPLHFWGGGEKKDKGKRGDGEREDKVKEHTIFDVTFWLRLGRQCLFNRWSTFAEKGERKGEEGTDRTNSAVQDTYWLINSLRDTRESLPRRIRDNSISISLHHYHGEKKRGRGRKKEKEKRKEKERGKTTNTPGSVQKAIATTLSSPSTTVSHTSSGRHNDKEKGGKREEKRGKNTKARRERKKPQPSRPLQAASSWHPHTQAAMAAAGTASCVLGRWGWKYMAATGQWR